MSGIAVAEIILDQTQRAVAMFVFAPTIAGAWLVSSDFHDDDTSS
jgi:hypothetical protein